ncbi:MAG: 4Fe-4S binding protein [Spirochaetes bacterium]|nr:4Fe-4S binding protein [Spirochaetota bacterium]
MKSRHWAKIRAITQLVIWCAFIVVIVASRDTTDNTFFSYLPRISPFLGLSISLATRAVADSFLPALVFLVLAVILGRFFCGWICPLGATIDGNDRAIADRVKISSKKKISIKSWKYIVLITAMILSIFGIQLAGSIDPISLSIRSYGTVIFAYLDSLLKLVFNALYYVPLLNIISEFIYSFLKDYLLDYNKTQYYNHLPVFLFFAFILLLSLFARRFWCKALCPLGAIYSLTGKIAFLKRYVDTGKCTNCLACEKNCRMDAIFNKGTGTIEGECIKCFDCLKACKFDAIKFRFSFPYIGKDKNILTSDSTDPYPDIQFTRKKLFSSVAASVIAVSMFKRKPAFAKDHSRLIRPPGALSEQDFINACVRCGQCMKVCPTNGLHPVLFEYGPDAVFTPQLIPRLGFCEKNCNQCSAVCPSGALQLVPLAKKETTVIGTAYIIRDLCIPWSEYTDCLVCEEMCPTNKKSIIFKEESLLNKEGRKVRVKLPYVREDICIGCGACENKCPVQGDAAIQVRTPKKTTIL